MMNAGSFLMPVKRVRHYLGIWLGLIIAGVAITLPALITPLFVDLFDL